MSNLYAEKDNGEAISWQFIFYTHKHWDGGREAYVKAAADAAYPYYAWNGLVYSTTTRNEVGVISEHLNDTKVLVVPQKDYVNLLTLVKAHRNRIVTQFRGSEMNPDPGPCPELVKQADRLVMLVKGANE